jgi:hypothetical protein
MKHLAKYELRTSSCLTRSTNFETIAKIENFPVFFGCTEAPEIDDLYAEMEWLIEPATGLIQLNRLIPLDILYQSQHAYGFGETWENHYAEFSGFLLKNKIKNVLEIGGGQGRIATITTQADKTIRWTIIEPNPTLVETDAINIIRGFFDQNTKLAQNFDTYSFSHVLEHAYNPAEFLKNIYLQMRDSDKLIFSYPNLKAWLSKKFTNSLNFEHTIFLTDNHLDTLLKNIGFEIIEKRAYLDHSFFYYVKKEQGMIAQTAYENLYSEHNRLLTDFIDYHVQQVTQLNSFLQRNSGPMFLFGAHIFSQYLKVFGLKTDKIISVLDNSSQKQGKRLYGTNLQVESPKALKDYEKPVVILRAGPYNDEIRKDILNNINSSCEFI